MSAAADARSTQPRSFERNRVLFGAVSGVLASLIMAVYVVVAALTYQGVGFFTPLYHIASLVISPDYMTTSMQQADAGNSFTFYAVPALVGASIHMVTGASFGAMFGSIVAAAPGIVERRPWLALTVGALWGVVVYLSSTFVLLSLAATVFGSGDQITNMSSLVGQGSFLVEHVIFGVALGALMWRAARRDR